MENTLPSKFLKNESGSTVFSPQSLGQLKWKYIHAFLLYTVYLACICWTLDSFSRAFLSGRVEFSVYSGFQNCYLLSQSCCASDCPEWLAVSQILWRTQLLTFLSAWSPGAHLISFKIFMSSGGLLLSHRKVKVHSGWDNWWRVDWQIN